MWLTCFLQRILCDISTEPKCCETSGRYVAKKIGHTLQPPNRSGSIGPKVTWLIHRGTCDNISGVIPFCVTRRLQSCTLQDRVRRESNVTRGCTVLVVSPSSYCMHCSVVFQTLGVWRAKKAITGSTTREHQRYAEIIWTLFDITNNIRGLDAECLCGMPICGATQTAHRIFGNVIFTKGVPCSLRVSQIL